MIKADTNTPRVTSFNRSPKVYVTRTHVYAHTWMRSYAQTRIGIHLDKNNH